MILETMNLFLPVTLAHIRAASATEDAQSYIDEFATSRPTSSAIRLWYSKSAWSIPWLISG